MSDMLVKLYQLPSSSQSDKQLTELGVSIRRSIPPEKHIVLDWVLENFSRSWVSQCDVSYSRQPCSCFIAIKEEKLVGFACYDVNAKGVFGPTGVSKQYRGSGIGKALLLICMHDMLKQGYAYAIIGRVGPIEFYEKAVQAVLIDDSKPGIFRGVLQD